MSFFQWSHVKGSPVIFDGWHLKIASQMGGNKNTKECKYIHIKNILYTKNIAPLDFSDMFFLEIVYSHLKEKGLKDITMCFREQ